MLEKTIFFQKLLKKNLQGNHIKRQKKMLFLELQVQAYHIYLKKSKLTQFQKQELMKDK